MSSARQFVSPSPSQEKVGNGAEQSIGGGGADTGAGTAWAGRASGVRLSLLLPKS